MLYGLPPEKDIAVLVTKNSRDVRKEFFHEMSNERLREIINSRYGEALRHCYSFDIRALAHKEIERRNKIDIIKKSSYDAEFRDEVVEVMVAAGIGLRVARELTSTEDGLMVQAKKFGVI